MREKLLRSDLAFLDVFRALDRLVAAHDEIAFEMHAVNRNVRASDIKPGKGKPARRIDAIHRFPALRPGCLRRFFCENGNLLPTKPRLERLLKGRANRDMISAGFDRLPESRTNIVI